ncbi:MAG: hypothetical protein J3Q66DRAFT_208850 [Benniella sp.]|nr:MAG: hypothetical protein J3Q66DRAFT_208850 [Benniella sp.]
MLSLLERSALLLGTKIHHEQLRIWILDKNRNNSRRKASISSNRINWKESVTSDGAVEKVPALKAGTGDKPTYSHQRPYRYGVDIRDGFMILQSYELAHWCSNPLSPFLSVEARQNLLLEDRESPLNHEIRPGLLSFWASPMSGIHLCRESLGEMLQPSCGISNWDLMPGSSSDNRTERKLFDRPMTWSMILSPVSVRKSGVISRCSIIEPRSWVTSSNKLAWSSSKRLGAPRVLIDQLYSRRKAHTAISLGAKWL